MGGLISYPDLLSTIKAKSEIWSNQINLCTCFCACRSPVRNVTGDRDVKAHASNKFPQNEIWVQDWGKDSSSTWVGCSTSCLGTGKVICPSAHVHTSNNVEDLKILQ